MLDGTGCVVRYASLEGPLENADRLRRERLGPQHSQHVREIPSEEWANVLEDFPGTGAHLHQTKVGIHHINPKW